MGTTLFCFLTNHAFDRQTDGFLVARSRCMVIHSTQLATIWQKPLRLPCKYRMLRRKTASGNVTTHVQHRII